MNKAMLSRVRIIFILVIFVFILLSGRLAYLQIHKHDYYWNRSEENRFTKLTLAAPRGEILDRNGKVLATNRPGYVVSLMDMGEGFDNDTITFLSGILEIEEQEIRDAIYGRRFMRYLPLHLQEDITLDVISQISENRWKLRGVNIEAQPIREYPAGSSAAHLIGYLSRAPVGVEQQEQWEKVEAYQYKEGELVGQDGLERVWEPWLSGREGEQIIETNTLGQPINYFERRDPVPGHNLYLTLDLDLQRAVEDALRRRVELLQSQGERTKYATAVLMDPNSGAILAMANYPSYDLNSFFKEYTTLEKEGLLRNNAIQGTYPIGSTYKMITGTAVIEEGLYNPRDITYCPGVITLAGDTKACYRRAAHGSLNFYDALALSCNIYFYRAGLRAGIDNLAHYAREYGFGSPTGLIDIPGEQAGIVASREYKKEVHNEQWYPAETMSAAIGQSYNSFTPLQLANYVSIIANGGIHYRPYLVDRVVDHEGNIVKQTEPEELRRAAISETTLAAVREAMRRVTQPRGTGFSTFSPLPFTVAGKTGSAEVIDAGGESAHSLFVGYAPYENPQVAIAVIVEHGGIGATGAVPVAGEILEYYFTGKIKGITDIEDDGDDHRPAAD